MQMHIARRLSEALGSWLHLEFCCYRGKTLSESSFKQAISDVLGSLPARGRAMVHTDYPHAALNQKVGRRGRPKSVDYALTISDPNAPKRGAQIVVEAKWSPSSHCTAATIYEDFLRLALIKRMDPATQCVFVLAGRPAELKKIVDSQPFVVMRRTKNRGIGVVSSGKPFALDRVLKLGSESTMQLVANWTNAGTRVPKSLSSQGFDPYPTQTPGGTVKFQAMAWVIDSVNAVDIP